MAGPEESAVERSHKITRLLALYPAAWRQRYGEEFSDLLQRTIEDGRGGLRLILNILHESNAARVPSEGPTDGFVGWIHHATHRLPGVPPHREGP